MSTLFQKIKLAPDPLSKFREGNNISAGIYSEPFQGNDEVVAWFYDRNTKCQVFFACSEEVWYKALEDSWADVSDEFTAFVEQELMPFCVENTSWGGCEEVEQFKCSDYGCHCEPFGSGDFTYGTAEEREFTF